MGAKKKSFNQNSNQNAADKIKTKDVYSVTEFSKLLLSSKSLESTYKSFSKVRKSSKALKFIHKKFKGSLSKAKIGKSNISFLFDTAGTIYPNSDKSKIDTGIIIQIGISGSDWKDRIPSLFGLELDQNYVNIRKRLLSLSNEKSLSLITKNINSLSDLEKLEAQSKETNDISISNENDNNEENKEFDIQAQSGNEISLNSQDINSEKLKKEIDNDSNNFDTVEDELKINSKYSFFNRLVFIHHGTSNYLLGGADLMAPGISHFLEIQTVSDQKKNTLEIIAKEKKAKGRSDHIWCLIFEKYSNYPFAIGVWVAKTDHPKSGVVVEILHRYNDYIWNSCIYNGALDPFSVNQEENINEKINEETQEENTNLKEQNPLTKVEQDNVLKELFLSVLKEMPDSVFPLDASTVYKQMIKYSKIKQIEVNIKSSSWKKLATFIKDMSKENIVKSKVQNDIISIHSVNRSYPGFNSVKAATLNSTDEEKKIDISYTQLYEVPKELSFLLPNNNENILTYPEALTIITKYLEKYRKGGEIEVPQELLITSCKSELLKAIKNNKAKIKDVKSIIEKALKIKIAKIEDDELRVLGNFKFLEIKISKIMGNKYVTKVKNFEAFELPFEHASFQSQLQKFVSASIKVKPEIGWDLLIQGNASTQFLDFLHLEYGFNPKHATLIK